MSDGKSLFNSLLYTHTKKVHKTLSSQNKRARVVSKSRANSRTHDCCNFIFASMPIRVCTALRLINCYYLESLLPLANLRWVRCLCHYWWLRCCRWCSWPDWGSDSVAWLALVVECSLVAQWTWQDWRGPQILCSDRCVCIEETVAVILRCEGRWRSYDLVQTYLKVERKYW